MVSCEWFFVWTFAVLTYIFEENRLSSQPNIHMQPLATHIWINILWISLDDSFQAIICVREKMEKLNLKMRIFASHSEINQCYFSYFVGFTVLCCWILYDILKVWIFCIIYIDFWCFIFQLLILFHVFHSFIIWQFYWHDYRLHFFLLRFFVVFCHISRVAMFCILSSHVDCYFLNSFRYVAWWCNL